MEGILLFYETEEIVKDSYQDSGTTRQVLSDLVTDGLAPYIDKTLKGSLLENCFVFFADGWSDRNQSHLTLAVRYWDREKGV
jgi:hypothetical protein